jgi:ADP-ribosylglycohydrolase
MYFAAVIASAFGTDSVEEALEIGLEYIPTCCEFSRQIRWALEIAPEITDYERANRAVSERFRGMDPVHAINNACLTLWGIIIGKDDFSKGISETVSMAYDNDCTAATVGSVLGAFLGIDQIPEFWYTPWNNTAVSYLNGIDRFDIEETILRFYAVKKSL